MKILFLNVLTLLVTISTAAAQDANYDESKVGTFKLPETLVADNGARISSVKDWENIRRKEIIKKFETYVYGRIPGKPAEMRFDVVEKGSALNGKATRIQARIYFDEARRVTPLTVLMYIPEGKRNVPMFVGLNFNGNHTVHDDPAIVIPDQFRQLRPENKTPERGSQTSRWQVEELIANGFGVATAWYEELEADHKDGYKTGVRTTLARELNIDANEWAALAVWAWGLHRMVDFLETVPQVDASRIALVGHSRLGKAALWAVVNDARFALMVSNNAGEGGAALTRRNFGETVERINTRFPHWFIDKYKEYNNDVSSLPVDQHMLLALIAPRPLYVASATDDRWADPKGEFLSAVYAGDVYKLYGRKGLGTDQQPNPDKAIGNTIRYHIRTGKHDITPQDWVHYIAFAKEMFR